MDESINKLWCIHTMEFNHEKEWSTETYYKLDKPQKRYDMWKKPDTKGHILYDFYYMKYMWNIQNRQIHRDRKQISGCRWMGEEIMGSYLMNIEWISGLKKKGFFVCFLFIFLAALGLHCCVQAFSSCSERRLLFVAVHGLLIAMASLVAEHGL